MLLCAPTPRQNETETPNTTDSCPEQSITAVYRSELDLLFNLAPKPNQYGLEEDDLENIADEDEDDEYLAHFDSSQVNSSLPAAAPPLPSGDCSDTDIDSTYRSGHSDYHANAIVDYSSVGRLWMSRMPGYKLIRRPICKFHIMYLMHGFPC